MSMFIDVELKQQVELKKKKHVLSCDLVFGCFWCMLLSYVQKFLEHQKCSMVITLNALKNTSLFLRRFFFVFRRRYLQQRWVHRQDVLGGQITVKDA